MITTMITMIALQYGGNFREIRANITVVSRETSCEIRLAAR